jgi:hypothetical protein
VVGGAERWLVSQALVMGITHRRALPAVGQSDFHRVRAVWNAAPTIAYKIALLKLMSSHRSNAVISEVLYRPKGNIDAGQR